MKWVIYVGAGIFFLTAVSLIVHQVIVWGHWFEWKDLNHHEVAAVICFLIAVFLVIINKVRSK